ncbi:ARIF-1 [Epiphyas postvittana nucleopolyhedrovirus]|uniref:ARIF-1 n=1 Tax=Epiphyas postvittana nucleopolyhedrovirus TaxID=70600 RepID=Q91GN2_NPVEP|nr:ARIF-1 [Epiphyas postvittana nucleopolyhedrovirus]AAK85581.1 ARIF-1 [Epiphyas postvittana nucleopolyhedrovirus]
MLPILNMLSQINYFLQLLLNIIMFTVHIVVFVFSLMGTVNQKYALLLELNDGVSVLNISLLTAFMWGPYVLIAITYYMYKIILYFKKLSMKCDFYIKSVIIVVNVLALICWLLFVIFQPQIYQHGHVPVLDVMYREYDLDSLCWSNVYVEKYDAHDTNAIVTDRNCVYQHNFIKKCIGCRIEVQHDEPTVFNQNPSALIMMTLTIIIIFCWNMYVQQKEMRTKPEPAVESNEEGGYTTDEEESQLRLLEVMTEGRSSTTGTASSPDSGVQFSFFGDYEYSVPRPVYSVPRKPIRVCCVPVPPPLPNF